MGIGTYVGAMSPIRPNALWALDFQFDSTVDGRQVKLLNIIDEFTRECLAIVVDHSIDADRVVATLERLAFERGTHPAFVMFDNGPEFASHAVADCCKDSDTASVSSIPGRRGKTPGSSHSTVACATSGSTCGNSTHCSKPK